MRDVIEVQLPCNLFCREFSVLHQVSDFHHGELSDPITRGSSAHLSRNLVQMFRCHAEFLRVMCYSSMFSVGPRLQHSDETRHNVGRPQACLFAFEKRGMSIHDIKVKCPHSLQNGLLTIGFRRMFSAKSNFLEVVLDNGKHVSLQRKNGMHEEMKPSTSPITAVRHQAGLLFGRQKKLEKLAIIRGLKAANMTRHRYHATSCRKRMLATREVQAASSSRTKEVQNLLLHDDFQSFYLCEGTLLPLQKYEKKGT